MTEMKTIGRPSGKRPNYKPTAAALLERCRSFYEDPENERAFLEWKAGKERKDEKKAV